MRFSRAALAALLLCMAADAGSVAKAAGTVRIAVLVSHSAEPYSQTLAGFHRYVDSQGFQARYDTYHLEGSAEKTARAIKTLKRERPDLLLTLGSLATDAAQKEIADTPIVAGMVIRGSGIRKSRNATGVFLEFPVETQFKWIRRILPDARTVGVLYNPGENRARIESASRAAASMGLRLEPRQVKAPQDLPEALDTLGKTSDVLWGLYDTVALTPETAKHVLLFSFRSRIPMVGLSSSWVKAGALYALEWDYADMGAQCGEMACQILRGAAVESVSHAPPRKTVYVLNLNTAKQMRIEIPETLVRGAGKVFKGAE